MSENNFNNGNLGDNNLNNNGSNSSGPFDADYTNVTGYSSPYNNAQQNYSYRINNNNEKHKNKDNKLLKIVSCLLILIFGAILGGTATGAFTFYVLPKTKFFKSTPLYKSISGNTGSNRSSVLPAITTSSSKGLTVAEINKKVSPAVVSVATKTVTSNDYFGFSQGESSGMGSGVIINEDGYILTNNHVISGATNITVIFNNKKQVAAKVVNYDAANDLAVIKLTEKVTVPGVAELGNSGDLVVGDQVVAIGNPLGEFMGSVTTGVVSALDRSITVENTTYKGLIQTDAAINPGNSGGPLVNSLGQVIGINSVKVSSGKAEGIGFAIPIDNIKSKLSNLLKPMLKIGISCYDLDKDTASQNNVPQGILVKQVETLSAAEKAGLKIDDIIVKFDGKKVTTTSELNQLKAAHTSGDVVKIVVYRDGKEKELSLKLAE